jgi:hypothetical protein
MSPLLSTHTIALLTGAPVGERRHHDRECRRAAMRAARTAYAGRLRRFYALTAPQLR